ncbi:MAG: hypothetical protein V4561_10605 [Bacteroidota bacterium]
MKQVVLALPFVAIFFAMTNSSCQQSGKNGVEEINDTIEASAAHPRYESINLIPVVGSPEFDHAELSLRNANATLIGKDSTKVAFAFDVKNYNLKNQTSDAANKQCNNSDKGQHIHFIMDNKPYVALYEPKHEITLAKNSEHYLMCFLSRSYHESIKTKGAAFVYHFKIDENGKLVKLDEPKTPMLFYSRPKGDYLGKDTTNLLLDFYVWNASLGNDFKVIANIKNETTGQSKEATIDNWQAMFIEHMGTGKASVSISLTDKDGKAIEGPMTSATRNIQLAAQEPLQ